MRPTATLLVLLSACGANWKLQDIDGDGYTPADGDCWDSLEPLLHEGSKLDAASIHPGATETWYDGIDQDCGGDDDFDADGDGWVPERGHLNRGTWNSPGSATRHLGAGDCWDAPDDTVATDAFAVVAEDVAGILWTQPLPSEVHPGVAAGGAEPGEDGLVDTWYDGVDQDCGGDDDFDADGDGWRSSTWPDATGALGEDCDDGADTSAATDADWEAAAAINPDAEEVWYDGVDQDCDLVGTVDCDQDGDGYRADPNSIDDLSASPCLFSDDEAIDCRDDDATVQPDPDVAEVAYNGTDDNCDASDGDGDKDGDGHWAVDYEAELAARGVTADDTVTLPDSFDDCWDDDDVSAADAGTASGVELRVLDGFDALTPAAVYPGAADRPYDGASQDCADADADGDGVEDDFDWDGDGYTTSSWPTRAGASGGDCIDCPAACTDGSLEGTEAQDWCDDACGSESANGAGLDPTAVNPAATEAWYDGTDQDCDGASDDDADGDGRDHSAQGGDDCFEGTDLDAQANPGGVAAADIHPDATETWYDGTDQDCDGASDNDADGDGYDHDAMGGGDCIEGTALDTTDNGAGLDPGLVYPGATDTWYDGTDQDCSGGSDLDADRDGFDHEAYGGTDCIEGTLADTSANPSGAHPAAVRPGATEIWYDGTDDDCDDNDGDADGDGHAASGYAFVPENGDPVDDCDDTAATTHPGADEIIGDEIDQDCDDAEICYVDADGDGVRVDAATVVASDDLDCTDDGEAPASATAGDCDDADNTVAPGQTERCDGLDNDCNGFLAGIERDLDGDGYVACSEDAGGWDGTPPVGFDDCDDFDTTVLPGAAELCDGLDNDCDGTIPTDESDADLDGHVSCTIDAGGWDGVAITGGDDCDDGDAATYVGATEIVGDGVDQDCDGGELCYVDVDGDGVHDGSTTVTSDDADCDDAGEVDASTPSGDCDDGDSTVYAGATEVVGDGVDQDCDGGELCYTDADDDGYRPDTTSTVASVDEDCDDSGEASLIEPTGDCDDTTADRNPGATEVCDALDVDEDCDGLSDTDDSSLDPDSAGIWYVDGDGDGFGADDDPGTVACEDPSDASTTYVSDATDCDDADPAISPSATEICDALDVDEDCNGVADDADSGTASAGKSLWYVDGDEDGFGDPLLTAALACDDPSDGTTIYADQADDCDDGDAGVNPDGTESVADGIDGDCDGVELCYVDADDDGYRPDSSAQVSSTDLDCTDPGEALATDGVDDCDDADATRNPGAAEVCDAADVDEDCDGLSDDADPSLDGSTRTAWVLDADEDGYGDETASPVLACEAPAAAAYVSDATDCDDSAADINPGATEVCSDGVDNDCDGSSNTCELTGDLSLTGDEDGRWLGLAAGDAAGYHLALLGDVTGDGDPDIGIGAPGVDGTSASDIGAAYLVSGPVSGDQSLSSAVAVSGVDAGDEIGMLIRSADVDGDGQQDLLLGAPGDGTSAEGALYVLYGPVTSNQDISGFDARLRGALPGESLGASGVGLGDILGLGADALLLGAPDSSLGAAGAGIAYLALGPLSGDAGVSTVSAVLAYGEAAGDEAGRSVSFSGDLTGDGTEELAIGAPGQDGGGSDAGAVYLYTGPTSGLVSLGDADIKANGAAAGDAAGWMVSPGGDIDGDGLDDLLIGAPLESTGGSLAGAVYVLYGSSSMGGTVDLGLAAARVTGQAAGDLAGYEVSAAGDVNVDGTADFIVGGPDHGTAGTGAGAAWLVTGPITGSVSLSSSQARLLGGAAGDEAGAAVLGAGDLDGDGAPDLLIGSPGEDTSATDAGAATLLLGGGL
jgi:hypothetical protein